MSRSLKFCALGGWPTWKVGSIERHAAADVGGHVEVFAVVNGRLAFLEATSGNDFQRQCALAHFRPRFAVRLAVLLGKQLLFLVRSQIGWRRHEPRSGSGCGV